MGICMAPFLVVAHASVLTGDAQGGWEGRGDVWGAMIARATDAPRWGGVKRSAICVGACCGASCVRVVRARMREAVRDGQQRFAGARHQVQESAHVAGDAQVNTALFVTHTCAPTSTKINRILSRIEVFWFFSCHVTGFPTVHTKENAFLRSKSNCKRNSLYIYY